MCTSCASAPRSATAIPGLTTELIVAGGPDFGQLDDDPEVARLRRMAGASGVAHRVRLTGRVPHDDVPALLRSADVVVSDPRYEPSGIAPVDAMACGKAVIVSAVSGHLDTVQDGVTGRLVPPRDRAALTAALAQLLAEPRLRRRFGMAGAPAPPPGIRGTRSRPRPSRLRLRTAGTAGTAGSRGMSAEVTWTNSSHLARPTETLRSFEPNVPRPEAWGWQAAHVLMADGRLLACGDGGSAEQAQHLTTELVGRYPATGGAPADA